MLRISEIKLPLDHEEDALKTSILKKLKISGNRLQNYSIFKRSYDARKKKEIALIYTLDLSLIDEESLLKKFEQDPHVRKTPNMEYRFVGKAPDPLKSRPIVIGMGPSGLFTGLILAQMGFQPLILERGKAVRERAKDTFQFWRDGTLDVESNVQFGEGGAGTFSDGKLYSQVKDAEYRSRKVLKEFVDAGAPDEILYLSKPHIGTFRLVSMVEKMRSKMLKNEKNGHRKP